MNKGNEAFGSCITKQLFCFNILETIVIYFSASHYSNVTTAMPVVFKRPKYHRGSIYTMAWSPDGRILATGSNDKSIKILHFDRQHCVQTNDDLELNIHNGTVRELTFVPKKDGLLISGGAGILTNCFIF